MLKLLFDMGNEMQQSFLFILWANQLILYHKVWIECKYVGTTISIPILYREISFENPKAGKLLEKCNRESSLHCKYYLTYSLTKG